MASLVHLHLAKDCGLEGVELIKPFPKIGNPNDSALPREYKLTTTDQFRFRRGVQSFRYDRSSSSRSVLSSSSSSTRDTAHNVVPLAYTRLPNINEDFVSTRSDLTSSLASNPIDESESTSQEFRGWISPTSNLTLPKNSKEKAGIPPEAKRYSFMHPPSGLANMLDWDYYRDKLIPLRTSSQARGEDIHSSASSFAHSFGRGGRGGRGGSALRTIDQKPDDSALAYFSMLGGFVYFDIDNKILQINAIALCKKDSVLHLMGPFSVPKSVCRDMHAMKRSQLLPIDIFHEAGFTSVGKTPDAIFQNCSFRLMRSFIILTTIFRVGATQRNFSISPSNARSPEQFWLLSLFSRQWDSCSLSNFSIPKCRTIR